MVLDDGGKSLLIFDISSVVNQDKRNLIIESGLVAVLPGQDQRMATEAKEVQ